MANKIATNLGFRPEATQALPALEASQAPTIQTPPLRAGGTIRLDASARGIASEEAMRSFNGAHIGNLPDPVDATTAELHARAVRVDPRVSFDHPLLAEAVNAGVVLYRGPSETNVQRDQRLAEPRAQLVIYDRICGGLDKIAGLRAALDAAEKTLLAHRSQECPGVTSELLAEVAAEKAAEKAARDRAEMERRAMIDAAAQIKAEREAREAKERAKRDAAFEADVAARAREMLRTMGGEG